MGTDNQANERGKDKASRLRGEREAGPGGPAANSAVVTQTQDVRCHAGESGSRDQGLRVSERLPKERTDQERTSLSTSREDVATSRRGL